MNQFLGIFVYIGSGRELFGVRLAGGADSTVNDRDVNSLEGDLPELVARAVSKFKSSFRSSRCGNGCRPAGVFF